MVQTSVPSFLSKNPPPILSHAHVRYFVTLAGTDKIPVFFLYFFVPYFLLLLSFYLSIYLLSVGVLFSCIVSFCSYFLTFYSPLHFFFSFSVSIFLCLGYLVIVSFSPFFLP